MDRNYLNRQGKSQKEIDEGLAKNAVGAGSSKRKSFWSTFRNLSKRKQVSLALVILLLLSGLVLLSKNVFFADVLGVNFTGKIYGQDTKLPLAGVNVFVSSSNEEVETVTAATDESGLYSLTLPDPSYNQVLISKDGYWDLSGSIINAGGINTIEASLDLKPGFGKEDVELVAINKAGIGKKTFFGLSVQPFDDSPSSLKQIVPDGNSYTKKSIVGKFAGYDLEKNDFIPASNNPSQAVTLGNISSDLTNSAVAYSPDTDRYYIFKDRKIYEYDRNTPNELTEVNQSEDNLGRAAAVYLPEYRLILMVGNGHSLLYRPQDNKVITLIDREVPEYDRQQFVRAKDSLFLLGELNASPGKTGVSSINIANMMSNYPVDTCFEEGRACVLKVNQNLSTIQRSGLAPYYYSKEDKIYLLGGINGEDGKVSDRILVFDPNNSSQTATELDQNHKLPKPVANSAYYATDTNFYLYGGIINTSGSQNSINKETITFRPSQHNANIESYKPTFSENISNYPFVQDNSGRTIIFTPNVLSVSGALTLKAGQAYYVEQSSKDYTLVFRGRSQEDNFSFNAKEIQENNWQNYQPVWFANPFMNTITFNEVTIRYQDKDYSLKEAADAGIINNNITASGYNNASWSSQRKLDLNNLTESFSSGDYLAFHSKKSGVKIYIGKENIQLKAVDASSGENLLDVDIYSANLTLDLSNSNYIAEKPGYNQKFINIVNPSHVIDVGFNLEFNPGGEIEYLEAFPMQKDKKVEFGLSLEPKDANAVKTFSKQGDSFTEQPITDDIYIFDYEKQDFVKKEPSIPLSSGYVYSIQPSSNYTLVVDGGNSTGESGSFIFESASKPYKVTPTFLNNIPLGEYQIDHQGDYYSLYKAAEANLIEPEITVGPKKIDLRQLSSIPVLNDYQVRTGEILSFEPRQPITLNQERIIEYDYRAYTAIPQIVEELSNEQTSDEEIFSILYQLDSCEPAYFEAEATAEEMDECLNSVQFSDEEEPVSLNNSLITKASAATRQRKKEIVRKYPSDFQVKTDQFIKRVKSRRKTYGKQKEELGTWDWPKFLQTTNSETNRYKFMYDDQKTESYWKKIPKNPIFRKRYWSDQDLNVLYIWYWSDLASNRYSTDFTPEERKRIQKAWTQGLDRAAAKLPSLPNPGDISALEPLYDAIGLKGSSPMDDVFMLMPYSKFFVKPIECVKLLGKKICSSAVKPVTKVVSQPATVAAGKKAAGYATKGRVGKVATGSATTKQYEISNLSNIIRKYDPQDAIGDFIEIDFVRSVPNSSKEALSATKRLYGYATILVEKLPQSEIFWSDIVAANGAGEYGAASKLRFNLERIVVVNNTRYFEEIAAKVNLESLQITIPLNTATYDKGNIVNIFYHEIAHTLPKDRIKYDQNLKNFVKRITNEGSRQMKPIEEMYCDGMSEALSYELAGIDSWGGSGYYHLRQVRAKLTRKLAYKLFPGEIAADGTVPAATYWKTERLVLKDMTRYGLKDGLDKNFNNLARAKRIIGQNESFHDALVNQIRRSPEDAEKAINFIDKL